MKTDQLKGDIPVRISQDTLDTLSSRRANSNVRNEGPASVFSVRYGFRPDSLDETKPFQLTKENEEYVIEGQGVNNSDPQVFRGQATESKSTDYVLVLDESSGSFELLPLNSTLRVNRSREKPKQRNGITMPTAGSSKSPSPASSSSNSHSRSISPIEKADLSKKAVAPKPEPLSSSKPSSSTLPSQAKPRKKAQVKKEPVSVALKKKKAPVKKSVASKKPPAPQPTNEVSDEDEVDEELMGALENELEGSLEDETNNNAIEESEESDEDEEVKPGVLTLEPEARNSRPSFVNNTASGPISLRGYVSGSRPEEEDLSSSEEE